MMSTTQSLEPIMRAAVNTAQLVEAVEDMGFDDVDVRPVCGGFGLFIADARIAVGQGDTLLEASEDLLDRAASVFYFDAITD